MISEKKARIMTNNIVADINHILDVIAIINQATSEEKIRNVTYSYRQGYRYRQLQEDDDESEKA